MKITIDRQNKTIEFEGSVNINELLNEVMLLLPNEYSSYSISGKGYSSTYTGYNPYNPNIIYGTTTTNTPINGNSNFTTS